MPIVKQFHTTSSDETVLPVTYIERYKDEYIKEIFKKYKFTLDRGVDYFKSKMSLERLVSDITSDVKNNFCKQQTLFLFTSPPSTMYSRGEKIEDSMRELLRQDKDLYTQIFSVRLSYIKHVKAQHIGSSRKKRLADMSGRYFISWKFKIKLWVSKSKNINITILDDVCSTGGTLLACKQTLEQYLQKKKPEVAWTIQVFSIAH